MARVNRNLSTKKSDFFNPLSLNPGIMVDAEQFDSYTLSSVGDYTKINNLGTACNHFDNFPTGNIITIVNNKRWFLQTRSGGGTSNFPFSLVPNTGFTAITLSYIPYYPPVSFNFVGLSQLSNYNFYILSYNSGNLSTDRAILINNNLYTRGSFTPIPQRNYVLLSQKKEPGEVVTSYLDRCFYIGEDKNTRFDYENNITIVSDIAPPSLVYLFKSGTNNRTAVSQLLWFPYDIGLTNLYKCEAWMAWKMGLTEILPIDHPYKYKPPLVGAS